MASCGPVQPAATAEKCIVHFRGCCCSIQGHWLEVNNKMGKGAAYPWLFNSSPPALHRKRTYVLFDQLFDHFCTLKCPKAPNRNISFRCKIHNYKCLTLGCSTEKNFCATYWHLRNQGSSVSHTGKVPCCTVNNQHPKRKNYSCVLLQSNILNVRHSMSYQAFSSHEVCCHLQLSQ